MKVFNLILFLSFLNEIFTNFNDFNSLAEPRDNIDDLVQKLNLTNNLNIILGYINLTSNTSTECIQNIDKYYRNQIEKIEKLYEGSSKGFVDMNSFLTCINDKENTYFSIYPNWTKEARLDIARLNEEKLKEHLWIFGVCLQNKFCSSKDIAEIFNELNTLFRTPFKLYTKDNIIVEDYVEARDEITSFKNAFVNLIPFYIIVIQIIFMFIKKIPVKIFQCCLRRKYLRDVDKSKDKKNLDYLLNSASLKRQIALKIRQCFSLSEIIDDFLLLKKNELFKDDDMTYIKGIKTLGIFLFIFGFSFTVLYNYPLCLSEVGKRVEYMTNFRTVFLIIAFRLSPALIISSSGYSLSYKFLNFLDKKLTNIAIDNLEKKNKENKEESSGILSNNESMESKDDNINKIAEKMDDTKKDVSNSIESSSDASKSYYENTFGIKFYSEDVTKKALNKIFKGQKIDENVLLSEISTDKIPFSLYFNFIFRQLHKFAFLGFFIVVFKLSFPVLLVIIGKAPLIYYIYKTYFKKLGTAVTNYIYIGNFIDLFSETDGFLMMQLFCIPMGEFNYFILCSIILFVCYKRQMRLDLIIILLIFICVVFKFIYVFSDLENRNPGMFYTDSYYQRFFFNPIFNFDFFLIGMLFGMVNYVIQNGLIKKASLIEERPFVKFPIYLAKLCDYHRVQKGKKSNNNIHFIFIIILLLFSLVIIPILFRANFETLIRKNDPSTFFVFVSLIDIELFTYCFHFFSMSCYVSGQNIFFEILNANISSYGLRLGYWVIFATPTFTYLLVYSNEANINLSFFMVLVYGAITIINAVVLGFISFLVLEMPYKKLIKLYFNITAELNKVYLEDESEENDAINNIDNNGMGMNDLSEKELLEEIGEDNNNNKEDDEDEFKD